MTSAARPRPQAGARVGAIYLVHFHTRFRHARHYLGWCQDIPARMSEHRAGRGAKLLRALNRAGIGYTLVAFWLGTRAQERRMKRRKGTPRLCPACRGQIAGLSRN